MKHEARFGAHVGTSSLLLIFLTLSLVSFSALSLAGAVADMRLSDKLFAHTGEYYMANHEAEAFVARTDAKLRKAYEETDGETAFFDKMGGTGTTSLIPMNDTQNLAVELEYVYPADDGGRLYRIKKWRIENEDKESYQRHLPVSGSGGLAGEEEQ